MSLIGKKCIDFDYLLLSERCSPFQWSGPKRFRPPACTIEELPEIIDAIVISHTHYDHLDYNSVLSLHQTLV